VDDDLLTPQGAERFGGFIPVHADGFIRREAVFSIVSVTSASVYANRSFMDGATRLQLP
jgi:hypothetical protein